MCNTRVLFIPTQKIKSGKQQQGDVKNTVVFFYTKHFITEEFKQIWLNSNILKPGEPL